MIKQHGYGMRPKEHSLKTFRIPISNSIYEGTLYAGSLHPNGKIAAVSGYTGVEWDQRVCHLPDAVPKQAPSYTE